jgi:hypothetical protein
MTSVRAEFLRLVAGVEVLTVQDGDIVVVEFLCKGLFPGPPPHPGILVVDVDPALVWTEGRDGKRVLLDHRVDAVLHPPDLGLLFPFFSNVVIDVQDTGQLVLLVEERDPVLLQDVGPGGELYCNFAINLLLLSKHLPEPLPFLVEDLEVPEGHRGDTRPVDTSQPEVCLVGSDDLHPGIDDKDRHRVFLDDRL